MAKRTRLTAAEIEAILQAAGDVDAGATFEDDETGKAYDAFERGMDKLRDMLAQREAKKK